MKAVRPEITGKAPVIGVTVAEAVRVTGLSRSTIWKLISKKILKSTSIGRARIVLFRSLQDLLEGHSEAAPGDVDTEGSKNSGNCNEHAPSTPKDPERSN